MQRDRKEESSTYYAVVVKKGTKKKEAGGLTSVEPVTFVRRATYPKSDNRLTTTKGSQNSVKQFCRIPAAQAKDSSWALGNIQPNICSVYYVNTPLTIDDDDRKCETSVEQDSLNLAYQSSNVDKHSDYR